MQGQCGNARPCHCESVRKSDIGFTHMQSTGHQNVSSERGKVVSDLSPFFGIPESGAGACRL